MLSIWPYLSVSEMKSVAHSSNIYTDMNNTLYCIHHKHRFLLNMRHTTVL